MNGDIYRLREELLERLAMLTERVIEVEEVSASAVSIADNALQDFEGRITALEANKCTCGNKATPTAVKELRSALPG